MKDTCCGRTRQAGQSSVDYVILSAILAFSLGLGLMSDDSVMRQLLDAFATAYRNFSFSIALP